jgi:hypothetical protein
MDRTLAEYLMERNALNPVMREEYDKPQNVLATLSQAAGAGAVSPFGLSEHLLRLGSNALGGDNSRSGVNARWAADRLYEMRNKHPVVSGATSGMVLVPLGGAAALGRGVLNPSNIKELSKALWFAGPLGAQASSIGDIRSSPEQRPQAAYPREDAY